MALMLRTISTSCTDKKREVPGFGSIFREQVYVLLALLHLNDPGCLDNIIADFYASFHPL